MDITQIYRDQFPWRPWHEILETLPPLQGQRVFDLGCGPGDQSAELAARGARVVGLDGHRELLDAARARQLAGVEFLECDLHDPPPLEPLADGLWASFVAAYFPDLTAALSRWKRLLVPGGWIALVEVDDLFGHTPLSKDSKDLLDRYVDDSLEAGRYDFRCGRKLEQHLERAGFTISRSDSYVDQELSFDGPARPEIVEAWRGRLERMKLLHLHCGGRWEQVRDDFLACLAHAEHRSLATVRFCLAVAR